MATAQRELAVEAADGHRWSLLARIPAQPRRSLLWLPALGVAARHYLPFADALAAQGVAVFLHEWRGHGTSSTRAGRDVDWGYRELLLHDLPASQAAVANACDAPPVIGGHSLGGQLACCRVALAPGSAGAIWLVASGSPWWRVFPARTQWWLPGAYVLLPLLARANGALPGRAVGFGGKEARGLVSDWARSGRTGCYAGAGIDEDLDTALSRVDVPVSAVLFDRDWLGPEPSLRYLLSKLHGGAGARVHTLGAQVLGTRADHFAWMKRPRAVASALTSDAAA